MSTKSKRELYRPVIKQNDQTKRTRKPLAQGRLVTESKRGNDAVKKTVSVNLYSGKRLSDDKTPLTPQKNVSRICETRSPKPSSNLDLSDVDVDICESESNTENSVIMVEATENFLHPEQSEVGVKVAVKKSPVRVVCHKNKAGDPDASTKTGNHVEAFSPMIQPKKPISKRKTPRTTPKVSETSSAKKVAALKKKKPNYPQPNFNDSTESLATAPKLSTDGSIDDDDDVVSVVSDVCSIDEYVPIIKSRTQGETRKPASKKPMNVVSVPSRYRQASVKSSTSYTQQKSSTAKGNKSLPNNKPATPKKSSPSMSQNSSKPVGGKTSTPCSESVTNKASDIDTSSCSAIPAEISAIAADISTLCQSKEMNSSNVIKKTKIKKQDIQRLDVLWDRYIQWLYLDSRAKKVFKDQEKAAMSQLNSLWEEVESLHEKETELELELARLKHMNQLDEQIEIQKAGLESVVHYLPPLNEGYHKLSESLDTTRHQISTKGIHIPDNEDAFQDALENTLQESEELLGQISMIIRQQTPRTTDFSTALQTTEKVIEAECKELENCKEFLAASKSLVTQESSLKIQTIQATQNT